MSKFRGVKTDNAKITSKVDIRKESLKFIKDSSVLEVFCGAGEMYKDVWQEANNYTGIDKRKFFDKRHTLCGDALSVVKQIDISGYNIFDIDAYGSPYHILLEIAQRIDLDHVSFCITDGTNMDLKMGRVSRGLREILGAENKILKKAHIVHDLLISQVIDRIASITSMEVVKKRIARGITGSSMRYYAFDMSKL